MYYLLDNLPWESSDGHNYLCGYGSNLLNPILSILECEKIDRVNYYF